VEGGRIEGVAVTLVPWHRACVQVHVPVVELGIATWVVPCGLGPWHSERVQSFFGVTPLPWHMSQPLAMWIVARFFVWHPATVQLFAGVAWKSTTTVEIVLMASVFPALSFE
jgi:hypothetical protein